MVGIGKILNKELKLIYQSNRSNRTYVYNQVSEYPLRSILDIKTKRKVHYFFNIKM